MARTGLQLQLRKRWFFWPAFLAVALLMRAGVLRRERGVKWICDHALVGELIASSDKA